MPTITAKTNTILDEIVAHKIHELESVKKNTPLAEVRRLAEQQQPKNDFAKVLAPQNSETAVIAEIKFASPSAGDIFPQQNPQPLAQAYEAGGAAAISVLTESNYFKGRLEYLRSVKAVCNLPLLRKDFLFEPYQLYEAKANGADAVLLITALFTASQLTELILLAREIGLNCLVEIHHHKELEIALRSEAEIIGINARNLKDFSEDIRIVEKLAREVPADRVVVAESAIKTREDVERVRAAGASAVLVGTGLMQHDNPQQLLAELRGAV